MFTCLSRRLCLLVREYGIIELNLTNLGLGVSLALEPVRFCVTPQVLSTHCDRPSLLITLITGLCLQHFE